jgi:hypothetical protein
MMKKIIWLIPLLFLFGCATTQQVADLEKKIAMLEKKKATDTMILAEQAGARRFWWRNALIGGGSALDGITGLSSANDGDAAFVMVKAGSGASATVTGYLYIYVYDDDTAENSPLIIKPNDAGGTWKLVNFNVSTLTSNSADGTHYFQAVNTVAFSGTPAEGMCYWKDTVADENQLCCYDADGTPEWRCIDFDANPVSSSP